MKGTFALIIFFLLVVGSVFFISETEAASDSFSDLDNTLLATHDSNWSSMEGDSIQTCEIFNNEVRPNRSWAYCGAVHSSVSDSSQIVVKAYSDLNLNKEVCVRASSGLTGYCMNLGSPWEGMWNRVDMSKNNSGIDWIPMTPVSQATDHILKITASGTNPVIVTAYVDGTIIGTHEDSDTPIISGHPGFKVQAGGDQTTANLDDWTDGVVDAEAPGAPSDLSATPISATQIRLTWATSTDNIGVAGYLVYRNGSEITSTVRTTFLDAGLSPSTSYSYSVEAYDSSGNTSTSSGVTIVSTFPPDLQPPTTPTGITFTAVSMNQVDISWSQSTDNVAVAGYLLFRNGNVIATSTELSYSDLALSPSTSYSYNIVAFDGSENYSGRSVTSTVVTQQDPAADFSPPSVPSGLAAVPISPSQINLAWNASTDNFQIAGYKIFRNGSQVMITSSTSYSDIGLASSTLYSYTISAFDMNLNESAQSAAKTTSTPNPLPGVKVYQVGPGQAYTSIGAVPWYSLQAGDTVFIHYRPTPYYEKFLISGQGTASQWIKVLGVPGPNGEMPIISGDGATTGPTMHHHWQDVSGGSAIQNLGIVQILVNDTNILPQYIEVAGLHVQDSGSNYQFTAENGTTASFADFSACIYARSAKHILIRNNILSNCGLGFYNWEGDGSAGGETWWDGTQVDTVIRGNYFYDNGSVGNYSMHQIYTESEGVVIEQNHFGPMKVGSLGSQIKDRSAGTVLRYNYVDQSPSGWTVDLVEPENGSSALIPLPTYGHDFIYGNIFVDKGLSGRNKIHWNEDHQVGVGRANGVGNKLMVYNNSFIIDDTDHDLQFHIFNETYGAYDCNPIGTLPGVIDFTNNIIAAFPKQGGTVEVQLGYCGTENITLGKNWITPGWVDFRSNKPYSTGVVTGTEKVLSPIGNNPGFVDLVSGDYHLTSTSSAREIAEALPSGVITNPEGMDFTPAHQYFFPHRTPPVIEARSLSGLGSDLGAFNYYVAASSTDPVDVTDTPTSTETNNPPPVVSGGGGGGSIGGGGGGSVFFPSTPSIPTTSPSKTITTNTVATTTFGSPTVTSGMPILSGEISSSSLKISLSKINFETNSTLSYKYQFPNSTNKNAKIIIKHEIINSKNKVVQTITTPNVILVPGATLNRTANQVLGRTVTPGKYTVKLTVIENKKVIEKNTFTIQVEPPKPILILSNFESRYVISNPFTFSYEYSNSTEKQQTVAIRREILNARDKVIYGNLEIKTVAAHFSTKRNVRDNILKLAPGKYTLRITVRDNKSKKLLKTISSNLTLQN